MSALLEMAGLTVAYGPTIAVKGIDLAVPDRGVVCLIGANGAGKTTTMRALSGLMRPRSGSVRFGGRDITRMAAHRIVRAGIVQVPEGRQIFANLSVGENLRLGGYLENPATLRPRQEEVLARFPRLRERLGQVAGTLSGGEQQMLAIGRALMAGPKLLLLDEPSMGLAPLFVEEIFSAIADLKNAGTTILLVEQNAQAALDVADYAYVMESGRIKLSGTAAEIAGDAAVMEAYLGLA